jgi:hypothetical protein
VCTAGADEKGRSVEKEIFSHLVLKTVQIKRIQNVSDEELKIAVFREVPTYNNLEYGRNCLKQNVIKF